MRAHSEVMQEVFGPVDGVGVRSAVGMMLPHGIATEVECVFELQPPGHRHHVPPHGNHQPRHQHDEVYRLALEASGLPEAVELIKAGAPRTWLVHGKSIESNLKAHFAARRAQGRGDGGAVIL